MAKFQKGHEKMGGRQEGVQNRLTRTVKEVVLEVFNELQTKPKVNLLEFAEDNPKDFYAIAAKLIPTEINAKLSKVKLEIVRTTPEQSTTADEQTSSEPTESD